MGKSVQRKKVKIKQFWIQAFLSSASNPYLFSELLAHSFLHTFIDFWDPNGLELRSPSGAFLFSVYLCGMSSSTCRLRCQINVSSSRARVMSSLTQQRPIEHLLCSPSGHQECSSEQTHVGPSLGSLFCDGKKQQQKISNKIINTLFSNHAKVIRKFFLTNCAKIHHNVRLSWIAFYQLELYSSALQTQWLWQWPSSVLPFCAWLLFSPYAVQGNLGCRISLWCGVFSGIGYWPECYNV